jgi:hypothetical protein
MFHHPGPSHDSTNVQEPADRQQLVIGGELPFDLSAHGPTEPSDPEKTARHLKNEGYLIADDGKLQHQAKVKWGGDVVKARRAPAPRSRRDSPFHPLDST